MLRIPGSASAGRDRRKARIPDSLSVVSERGATADAPNLDIIFQRAIFHTMYCPGPVAERAISLTRCSLV